MHTNHNSHISDFKRFSKALKNIHNIKLLPDFWAEFIDEKTKQKKYMISFSEKQFCTCEDFSINFSRNKYFFCYHLLAARMRYNVDSLKNLTKT